MEEDGKVRKHHGILFVKNEIFQVIPDVVYIWMFGVLGMHQISFVSLVTCLVFVWMGPVVMQHVHLLLLLRSMLVIVGMLVV